MTAQKISEMIFALNAFDLYDCFDYWGTIDEAKAGIMETVLNCPDDLLQWLSDLLEDINGGLYTDDSAETVSELITAVKELTD